MKSGTKKYRARRRRALRVRKKVRGSVTHPRMSVYRSLRNLSVQFINDDEGRTLCALSTTSPAFREKYQKGGGTVEAAALLGEMAGAMASGLSIKKVKFDRGCYRFHGRIKALAEGCRKAGLLF